MSTTERVLANQIMATTSATGAKAPKAVLDSYRRAVRISEAARSIPVPRGGLAVAVAAALDDGRDPASDPDVQRAVTANSLTGRGITDQVDDIAYARFLDVCRDQADAIISAWAKPFTVAAATLATAHQRIGSVALTDTDPIMRSGGDVAEIWSAAVSASQVIEAINAGWVALAQYTRLASIDPRYSLLRIASVDYATWTDKQLDRQKVTPWDAVILGLDPSLPTFTEYRRRVQTLEQHSQAAALPPIDTQRSAIAGREIRVAS